MLLVCIWWLICWCVCVVIDEGGDGGGVVGVVVVGCGSGVRDDAVDVVFGDCGDGCAGVGVGCAGCNCNCRCCVDVVDGVAGVYTTNIACCCVDVGVPGVGVVFDVVYVGDDVVGVSGVECGCDHVVGVDDVDVGVCICIVVAIVIVIGIGDGGAICDVVGRHCCWWWW